MIVKNDADQHFRIVRVFGIVGRKFKLNGAASRDFNPLKAHLQTVHILCQFFRAELTFYHGWQYKFFVFH